MPKALLLVVIAVAAGCAARPSVNPMSIQPAVEVHEVVDDHQTIPPSAQSVLVSHSGDGNSAVPLSTWPLENGNAAVVLPTWTAEEGNAAVPLSTWSPEDADSLSSDDQSVPPRKSSFQLLRDIGEKNPPFRQW